MHALVLAAAAMLSAEQGQTGPAAPTGTGLILGRVVDADSGMPVTGVIVTLATGNPGSSPGAMSPPRRVLVDGQGRFVFRSLPKGSYTLLATMGGNGYSPSGFRVTGLGHQIGAYLNGGYGQRRPNGPTDVVDLGEGERVADAVIRLWKGAVVEGTVFDEAGEPIVGLYVSAVRRSTDGRLLTGPSTKTDDRGAYRLDTLAPGDYLIVVPQTQVLMPVTTIESVLVGTPDTELVTRFTNAGAPSPRVVGVRVGSSVVSSTGLPNLTTALAPARRSDRPYVYQTTFYPTATTAGTAATITLRSGEERAGVDVHLTPVRTMEISGTLVDSSGPVANFGIHLLPADTGDGASVLEVATTATDGSGAFVFPLVPAGQYTVMAVRPPLAPGAKPAPGVEPSTPARISETSGAWAAQVVAIGDQPVPKISLALRAGVQIGGRFEFRGAAERPTADRLRQLPMTLASTQPLFRSGASPPTTTIDPVGAFMIRGVAPGKYVLRVAESNPPWTIESITVAGRDVTDAVITVADDDVTDLLAIFTDRPADVVGTARGLSGAVDPEASIFIFPVDRSRWPDARAGTRTFRTVRVSKTGAFRVASMVPGEYFVVAASDRIADAWPDEKFLVQLAPFATTIRVEAGQKPSVTLRTADIR